MIRINLIRQVQSADPMPEPEIFWSQYAIGALLLLMFSIGAGWWTQSLYIERERFLEEKVSKAKQLSQLQEAMGRLLEINTRKDGMLVSLEKLKQEVHSMGNVSDLMESIGESLQNLQVWLDSIHIEHEVVEIHGQAFAIEDVAKCLDRLENVLSLRGISFVEVREADHEMSAPYSFVIRLHMQEHAVT